MLPSKVSECKHISLQPTAKHFYIDISMLVWKLHRTYRLCIVLGFFNASYFEIISSLPWLIRYLLLSVVCKYTRAFFKLMLNTSPKLD